MSNYRRNFVAGGCYFFTVNLLERKRTLLTDHIDLLRDSVRRVKRCKADSREQSAVIEVVITKILTGLSG
jgi:REP element-mobilizing transposase RayT